MFERATLGIVVTAAAAAAAVLIVFALGFALFALVEPAIGPAGGAALVAFVAALGIAGFAFYASLRAQGRARDAEQSRLSLAQALPARLGALAAERPLVSLALSLAAGALAANNPRLTRDLVALMTSLNQNQD